MSLASIERHLDRIVPAFLLSLSFVAAIATAGVGIA